MLNNFVASKDVLNNRHQRLNTCNRSQRKELRYLSITEFINSSSMIGFSREEKGFRERSLVWGIRKMLCLQTKAVILFINLSALACDGTVQEISRVELDSRLIGKYFHYSSGTRIEYACGYFPDTFRVQNQIMVISNWIATGG